MASRGVEWLLRVAAVLSVATCLIWVLGSMGTGLIFKGPDSVRYAAQSLDGNAAGGSPAIPVQPEERVWEDLVDEDTVFNSSQGYNVPGAFAEFSLSWRVVVYEPTLGQRVVYTGLQCLLSLSLAWVWWTLARLVASSRRGDPFTAENAMRLQGLGLVLVVGGPAYAVGTWLIHRWLLAVSELADDATLAPWSWRDAPWWSVAVGLCMLVLAGVWRRGAAMRDDLVGLV